MATDVKRIPSVEMHEAARDLDAVKRIQTADTLHNDEAVRVLQAYHGDSTWTDVEENKLRRKLDWKLMPVLCMTYGLQYYDKAMLSQAVCPAHCSSFAFDEL